MKNLIDFPAFLSFLFSFIYSFHKPLLLFRPTAGMERDPADVRIRPGALREGEGWRHHQDGPGVWSGDGGQELAHPLQPGQVCDSQ